MRNSPRSFAIASRVTEDPVDCTTTRAPGTRAALASRTSPRSAPFGFCARRNEGTETKISRAKAQISELELRISESGRLASRALPKKLSKKLSRIIYETVLADRRVTGRVRCYQR